MAVASPAQREQVLGRLRTDFVYYAPRCLKIIDAGGRLVPFALKPPQVKLARALEAQRAAGEPMRALILKARKVGFSTETQGLIMQRATQYPNHRALVVAQDNDTAGELFDIGRMMWMHLPASIKPELASERNSKGGMKYLGFGEQSRLRRAEGQIGLNSSLEIDTAKEVQAGRGRTYHSLHLSEVAFWFDTRKLVSLLNAVPDHAETLIVQESTANGNNHFKDSWDRAEAGDSAYVPIFVAWFEEAQYSRPFASDMEREEFADTLGEGPWGEEEHSLVEEHDCSLEQLNWRRWAIVNKCEAKLEIFHQEYPSSAEQAFLSTGRQVFSRLLLTKVRTQVQRTDPAIPSAEHKGPKICALIGSHEKLVRGGGGHLLNVPQKAKAQGRDQTFRARALWRIFEPPDPGSHGQSKRQPGQYVIGVDPMSGEETDGEQAYHAIEVIDHRTRRQVAEYRSRVDPDELAMEVWLCSLIYNQPWVAVETTGGYGLSVVRRLAIGFKYPFVYTRRTPDVRSESFQKRLGWDTNRHTRPILIDGAKELLRTEAHGIRSKLLLAEMLSFVKDARGRSGPEKGKHSDLLMAWMIAQQVAQELPVRVRRRRPVTSTSTRRVASNVTGY